MKFTDISPPLELPAWPIHHDLAIVTVAPKAYAQAMEHLTNEDLEQGGLLIGKAWTNPQNSTQIAHVEILEAIPSFNDQATAYSLKMSTEVWATTQQRMANLAQADLRIVGWFHSHPHLGAFFSATDRATQAGFFNQPYSIGWVIDPFTQDADQHQAFFLGPNSVQLK
jgi:proteasome lid subunit RPN8/RPN11